MEGIQVNGAEATMSLQGKGQANRSRHSANFCSGIRFLMFVLNLSQIKLRCFFLFERLSFTSETQPPMSLPFSWYAFYHLRGMSRAVRASIWWIRAAPNTFVPCPYDPCRAVPFLLYSAANVGKCLMANAHGTFHS